MVLGKLQIVIIATIKYIFYNYNCKIFSDLLLLLLKVVIIIYFLHISNNVSLLV